VRLIDFIVTRARGVWVFFDNPHLLPANESIYPEADSEPYKGNRGRERWDLIGLGQGAAPNNAKTEDILMETIAGDAENT
jgi:hypothetical protein